MLKTILKQLLNCLLMILSNLLMMLIIILEMSIYKTLPWESFPEAFTAKETGYEDSKTDEAGPDGVDDDRFFAEIFIQRSKTGEVGFPFDFGRFTV